MTYLADLSHIEVREIGTAGVDTGRLLISDPSYLVADLDVSPDLDHRILRKEDSAHNAWAQSNPQGPYTHEAIFAKGHNGAGVAFSAGLGDGTYPVYATYADVEGWGRRIVRVEIVFIAEEQTDIPKRFAEEDLAYHAGYLAGYLSKQTEDANIKS